MSFFNHLSLRNSVVITISLCSFLLLGGQVGYSTSAESGFERNHNIIGPSTSWTDCPQKESELGSLNISTNKNTVSEKPLPLPTKGLSVKLPKKLPKEDQGGSSPALSSSSNPPRNKPGNIIISPIICVNTPSNPTPQIISFKDGTPVYVCAGLGNWSPY